MTPFMHLRLWWRRRASPAARVSSALAIVMVMALAAWVAVPTGATDDTSATELEVGAGPGADGSEGTADGQASGSDEATGATDGVTAGTDEATGTTGVDAGVGDGTSSTVDAPGSETGSSPGGSAGPDAECLATPGNVPSVSDEEVHIGVGLLDLGGPIGNSAAGVASAEELRRMGEAVIDDINARGGVQCRTLTATFYEGNPINPDQQRATCLEAVEDRPLVFADAGAFAFPQGSYTCLTQEELPYISSGMYTGSEFEQFSPFLASVSADARTSMRTVANALAERGWFDPANGFDKLGLLFDDCGPEVNRELETSLAQVGVTEADISKFEFQCPPSGFAPPNTMSQAVSQHRLDGVTHVIPLTGSGSFKTYTEIAESQRFRPDYAVTDYQGVIVTSASSLQNNPANFDRSIAITTTLWGQQSTPGMEQTPGTVRCQEILVEAGFSPDDVFARGGGLVCTVLWTAEEAINNARTFSREGVLPGLFDAGTVQMAWASPDTVYQAPSKFFGGDTWWPIEFHRECTCWRVLDPERRPSFSE